MTRSSVKDLPAAGEGHALPLEKVLAAVGGDSHSIDELTQLTRVPEEELIVAVHHLVDQRLVTFEADRVTITADGEALQA